MPDTWPALLLLSLSAAVCTAGETFNIRAYERSALVLRHVEGSKIQGVTRVPGAEAGKMPMVDSGN